MAARAFAARVNGALGCGLRPAALVQEAGDVRDDPATCDLGYYATSLAVDQGEEAHLLEIIRGRGAALENGTHCRRDVTLGEAANRTAHRHGAAVLASLRNLALGI